MAKELAKSARDKYETDGQNIFNRAFSGSYLGADDVALCSASHPLKKTGGLQSNLMTAASLAVTSLRSAITKMEGTVDDAGILQHIKPKILLCSTTDKFVAWEILKSSTRPDTSLRADNAMKNEDLSFFVGHYLTSTTAWFLLASKDDTELHFIWRRKFKVDFGNDFDTGDLKTKGTQRYSVGWSDFRGMVGNAGA
jgi:hypothetical protein